MNHMKSLQELTLFDRFLFDETMEKPENMRAMLEIILGKDIMLRYLPQTEKEQRTSAKLRCVKMDVWAQDEDGVIYDAESQQKNTGNLPKRSRYYQSLIDCKLLQPGVDDFNKLKPVVVIMIMPFDLFQKKKYRYTFSMRCEEVEGVGLNDGAVRIFLNTHGTDEENISPELKELLYLIEHTNDREKVFHSEKVRKIRESVQTIQKNEEVGVRYMQAWEERLMDRREAREETLKEVEHLIHEAEERQAEAEEKTARVANEAHKKEVQIFFNLLERGFSVEEAQNITGSGEDIVREALEMRGEAKPVSE